MDFLADENIPRPIIQRLRDDGFSVHAVGETNAGMPDLDVLGSAAHAGLILITQDHDFSELAIVRKVPVSGIVRLELARLPLSAQVERAAHCLAANIASFKGKLTVIEPARIRARSLPAI